MFKMRKKTTKRKKAKKKTIPIDVWVRKETKLSKKDRMF